MRLVQRIIRCKGSAHRYVVWVNGVARVVETSKNGCGFGFADLMKAFYGYLNPTEEYSSPLLTVEKSYLPPKKGVIQLEYLRDYRSPFLITENPKSSVIFISDYRFSKTIAASILTVITSSLFIEQSIALPTGAESVVGDIKFQTTGSTLDISTKAERAIARYNTFNIGQHETVNFNLPSRSSQILNFIGEQNPSQILGKLNSNGIVYLVNPNGLFFGQNAQVNVAGIVGSTLNINQNNFINGNLIFEKNQSSLGKIENQGIINLQNNGAALFLGNQIENKGTITGNNVHIGLYSGNKITVGLNTDNSIRADVSINTGTDTSILNGINNSGLISSTGGELTLQAKQQQNIYNQLINNSGVIEANGISTNNGTIEILAENGAVTNTGILDVSNTTGKGGTVHVLGDAVALDGNSLVNASGKTGGGEILIGGDYQGNNPKIKNAEFTYVGHNTQLKADATETGNGGNVVVWADDSTWYYGDISAKANQGDGGLAEVSGKEMLYFYGSANLTSQHGERGTLLLDPDNIYIMSPTLWLDASQLTGYTNGQAVSSWTDMSGNGNNATQGTAGARPLFITNVINGQPTVQFDGVDDEIIFSNSFTNPYTIIYLSRQTGGANGRVLSSITTNWLLGYWNGWQDTMYAGGWVASGGSAASDTQWHLYTGQGNGVVSSIWEGSSLIASNSGGIVAPGQLTLGRGGAFNEPSSAQVSELIGFNSMLSTSELNLLWDYFYGKWGINSTSTNTTVLLQSQIETLSQTANISLSATKDITIGKLNSGLLNLQGSANLTLTADSDLNGTGAVTMVDNTNTIRTTGGNINITASRLALGNLDTRGSSGALSADINLTALNNGISAGNIYTGGGTLTQTSASNFALNSVNTNGGAITLNALGNFYLMAPSLWLDANQIFGISNGSNLQTWNDLSGNGVNLTQGTLGSQGTYQTSVSNGLQVIRFDGVDDYYRGGAITTGTVHIVAKYNNVTFPDYDGLFSNTTGSSDGLYFVANSGAALWVNFDTDVNRYVNGSGPSNSITNLNQTQIYSAVDDTPLAMSGVSLGEDRIYGLSLNRLWNGDISEVVVLPTAVSAAERIVLDQYLGNKYGISVPSSGYSSVATQSQIQNLSLQGNVTINAKNDITVGKLNGGVLNMQGTSSLTLKADSDNNGSGAVSMVNSSDVLRTEGRAINITAGSGISISALNTTGATGTKTGGTITLNSDFDANNAGNLSIASTLTTLNGNVILKGPQIDINGVVNTNGADVSILPTTAKSIRLGGSTDDADSSTYLDLSNLELLRIKANNLTVGDSSLASDITLAGNLDLSGRQGLDGGAYNLTLNTLGNFDASGYQMHLGRDAMWFDGIDDAVLLSGNFNFSTTNEITLTGWLYLQDNGSYDTLIANEVTYRLLATPSGNAFYNPGTHTDIVLSNQFNMNNWYHYAMTVKGGDVAKMYINGVLVSTNSSGVFSIIPDVSSFTVGGNYYTPFASYVHNLKGQIDTVSIHNYILNDSEINSLFNNGLGVTLNSSISSLVSGYNFSEGSGTTASDIKGVNNGTLVNSPTWVRAKDLTINTGGNISLGKTLSDGGNVALNAGGNVNLNGLVGLIGDGNLTITSTGINKAVTVNSAVTANAINITTSGSGSDINLVSTLTATASSNAIVLNSSDDINNSYGVGVLTTTNGRWLTNTYERSDLINMPSEAFKRYNCVYGGSCPTSYPGSGNGALFRIAPVLTVTADNQNREYGDTNPSLTGTITGYIDGDTISVLSGSATYSTTATNTSNVGISTITSNVGTLSNSLGYQFDTVDGTLNITKASLTATADNKSRFYGSNNPVFTATYSGFKNGESSNVLDTPPTLASSASSGSQPGKYAITISSGLDNNYNFTYVNGELTIEGISEPEVIPFISNPIQNFGVTRGSNDIIYSSEKTEGSSNPNELFVPEIDTSDVENNVDSNTQIDVSELKP